MNRETLDEWCERGILGLVLAILVYGPLATGAVRAPDFLVLQGLTVGVMILWLARLWISRRVQMLWPPICWAVAAFSLYAIFRYQTAELEYVARMEMVRVLVYAFLFCAIVTHLHRQQSMQIILFTLIFLGMAISFYAIYQFITDSNKVWWFMKPYPHRGSGTYISPNHLAGLLEMVLPLGLAWVLVSRAKTLFKVFVGYASLIILAAIAVTVSRASWASVALVIILFFSALFFQHAYRIPAIVLFVVLAGIGLYFIPRTEFFHARFQQLTANGTFNDDARFDLWMPALRLWREDPWWGIGPDHFNYRFRAYRPETEQFQPDRVHNDYLNTLTDWGIVGAALVASACVLLWAGAFKIGRVVRFGGGDLGSGRSNKFALLFGASFGLLAIFFHSLVDFNMHIPANAIVAVTLMAIVSSCLRFATDKYWFTARLGTKIAVTLVLLAGILYFGWQGTRRMREWICLAQASRAPEGSPARIAALEDAFRIEPMNFETAYALGEAFRIQSWEGGEDYAVLAAKAMNWYKQSMALNPYDGYSWMRYGMCLDWLDRQRESGGYFDRAVRLDPNGYFTAANVGWHYVQLGDYAAAREWFERSQRLQGEGNDIAASYLAIVNRKLLEAAAQTNALPELLAQ